MANLLTGSEGLRSSVCGILGSEENSPEAEEDEDACSASRVPDSYVGKQKSNVNHKRLRQLIDNFKKSKSKSSDEASAPTVLSQLHASG